MTAQPPDKPKKRPWYRPHLLTVIFLVPAAGGLFCLNGWYAAWTVGLAGLIRHDYFGFPLPFCIDSWRDLTEARNAAFLIVDLIAFLAALLLLAALCEWLIRRWPRIRYSLRTLLLFTLLAGSGMGVWFKWEPWERLCMIQTNQKELTAMSGSPWACFPAISKDNSKILACDIWGELHLFEIQNGRELWSTAYDMSTTFYGTSCCCILQFSGEQTVEANYFNSNSNEVYRFDLKTGKQLPHMNAGSVTGKDKSDCIFSDGGSMKTYTPDGKKFATWGFPSQTSAIEIGDSSSGNLLAIIGGEETSGVIGMRFSEDGSRLAAACWNTALIYHRRRPEYWWGLAWLPEFWLALIFSGAFIWSVRRDRRELYRRNGEVGA
jgi:hypothetical protein